MRNAEAVQVLMDLVVRYVSHRKQFKEMRKAGNTYDSIMTPAVEKRNNRELKALRAAIVSLKEDLRNGQ